MSLIEEIKRAWDSAMRAVNGHHSYDDIPAPDLGEEFMKRLYRIPAGINVVVTTLLSAYSNSVSNHGRVLRDCTRLTEARDKITEERDELLESHSEWQKDYDTAMKEMRKYADKAEDLESALNTSRYFIFLSGMCGFLLGLACLYLVI